MVDLVNGLNKTDAAGAIFRGHQMGNEIRNTPLKNRMLELELDEVEGNNKMFNALLGDNIETSKQSLAQKQQNMVIRDEALDALELKNMLTSGAPTHEVSRLFENRIKKITDRGGDPSHTKFLYEELSAGRLSPEQLIPALDSSIMQAERVGVLKSSPVTKPLQPTTLERNVIAAGYQPGTPEHQAFMRDAITKPQTSVNVNTAGDKKFIEKVQEGYAKTLDRVTEEADAAIDANQSLEVLSNIDVETGALEPLKQGMAAFGTAFGLDTSGLADVSAGEAFNAEAQRLVLSVKATQKGPQTDKDEATIRKTIANLGNTSQGNQFIIQSAQALNNRKIERKEFYDRFIQDNGGTFKNEEGQTADQAWSSYKRETPLVSQKLRTPEGLPVFFFAFEKEVRAANPDATQDEILQAWRQADKGKR